MKTSAKNIIVITIITIVAGLFLGFVYEITKDPIAKQEQLTKEAAYKKVCPNASQFIESDISIDELNANLLENGFAYDEVLEVLEAVDGQNNNVGYVFSLKSSEGYGGDINVSLGIASDGTVQGVEILSISETAGLGMKADTDEFKGQFADKKVTRFNYTKTGKTADYEIDALSGATITTNAMTNVVNAGISCYEMVGGAN